MKSQRAVDIKIFDEKSYLNLLDTIIGFIHRKKTHVIIILNHRSDLGQYAEQFLLDLDSQTVDYISIINAEHLAEIRSTFEEKIKKLPRLMVVEKDHGWYELTEFET